MHVHCLVRANYLNAKTTVQTKKHFQEIGAYCPMDVVSMDTNGPLPLSTEKSSFLQVLVDHSLIHVTEESSC